MTQQFKFGDHVRRKEDGAIGVVVDTKFSSLWVVFEGDSTSNFYDFEEVEPIRHPDTVRLDSLIKRNFDFQKCYDMGGRWWYEDNSFDEIEGTEGMTEREAIDKVMEKETEK